MTCTQIAVRTPAAESEMPAIQIAGLNKWFGPFHALKNVDLTVGRGSRVVICGPSGSGKSTLIRCVNGLESFQTGKLEVNGICPDLGNGKANWIDVRRQVGMVFQQFNLFPHLTILGNCTTALRRVLRQSKREAEEIALHYLERVRIRDQAFKYPAQLSGGQQQRAAIARALCLTPAIMLFDEPTSALDPEMVKEVVDVMRDLAAEGMTMLCVTHEMRFARETADQIVFMDQGTIIETASPDKFFSAPREIRTRAFLDKIHPERFQ